MKEKIAAILKELKAKKIPASRVEKDLGFSNGLLKKAANGTKLSPEKLEKLVQYHDIKMNPTVDNGDGSITVRDKDLIPFLRDNPMNASYRKPEFEGKKLSDSVMDEPLKFEMVTPKKPPEPWVKKIEDYCGIAGITPEELIEQHAMKGAKKTMIEVPKEEKKKDPIQVKGEYDPFKNPKFMKLHGAQKQEKSEE